MKVEKYFKHEKYQNSENTETLQVDLINLFLDIALNLVLCDFNGRYCAF